MGGKQYLEQFVVNAMQEIGLCELAGLQLTVQHLKRDLSQARLTKLSLNDITATFRGMSMSFGVGTPRLWAVLHRLMCTADQQHRNTQKTPTLVGSTFLYNVSLSDLEIAGYQLYHMDAIIFAVSP